jgi:hypothetical protein
LAFGQELSPAGRPIPDHWRRSCLRCFTSPCSTSSRYTRARVSPSSCKNEDVSSSDGTPPTKPWRRKGDGIPAPSECTSRDVWA